MTSSTKCSYSLVFEDGSRHALSANDAVQALKGAQSVLPEGGSATLIEDGVLLARLAYSDSGFWTVSGPQ